MANPDDRPAGRGVPILGDAVRTFRRRKGWTQEQLAETAKCSQRTIQEMEKSEPKAFDTVKRVAEALGVSPEAIRADMQETVHSLAARSGLSALTDASPPTNVQGLSVTLSMPQEDTSKPALVAYFCEVFQRALADYQAFKQSLLASTSVPFHSYEELQDYFIHRGIPCDKIMIYFVPVICANSKRLFAYAVAPTRLHERFMERLADGEVIEECGILAMGEGDPPPEVRAAIKRYYGLDTDACPALDRTGTHDRR